jgi:hypothetical protein
MSLSEPTRTVYLPQIGDRVVVFAEGLQQYYAACWLQEVLPDVVPEQDYIVESVKLGRNVLQDGGVYDVHFELELQGSGADRLVVLKYHPSLDGTLSDYLVLAAEVDDAKRRLHVGATVQAYFVDVKQWFPCRVVEFKPHRGWSSVGVRWLSEGGEASDLIEWLHPWELFPVVEGEALGQVGPCPGVGLSRDLAIQAHHSLFKCVRAYLLQHPSMHGHFAGPLRPKIKIDVIFPLTLSLVLRRLRAGFYRSLSALEDDLRQVVICLSVSCNRTEFFAHREWIEQQLGKVIGDCKFEGLGEDAEEVARATALFESGQDVAFLSEEELRPASAPPPVNRPVPRIRVVLSKRQAVADAAGGNDEHVSLFEPGSSVTRAARAEGREQRRHRRHREPLLLDKASRRKTQVSYAKLLNGDEDDDCDDRRQKGPQKKKGEEEEADEFVPPDLDEDDDAGDDGGDDDELLVPSSLSRRQPPIASDAPSHSGRETRVGTRLKRLTAPTVDAAPPTRATRSHADPSAVQDIQTRSAMQAEVTDPTPPAVSGATDALHVDTQGAKRRRTEEKGSARGERASSAKQTGALVGYLFSCVCVLVSSSRHFGSPFVWFSSHHARIHTELTHANTHNRTHNRTRTRARQSASRQRRQLTCPRQRQRPKKRRDVESGDEFSISDQLEDDFEALSLPPPQYKPSTRSSTMRTRGKEKAVDYSFKADDSPPQRKPSTRASAVRARDKGNTRFLLVGQRFFILCCSTSPVDEWEWELFRGWQQAAQTH